MGRLLRGCGWAAVLVVLACAPGCKCTSSKEGIKVERTGPEPEELAAKEKSPRRLIVDDTHVYWTVWGNGMTGDHSTTGLVKRVDRAGKGNVEVFASAQSHPAGIAADATTIYWATEGDGNVMKLAKSGGTPAILTTKIPDPGSVVADASGVYVGTQSGQIWMVDTAGAPKQLGKVEEEPRRILVDDKDLFTIDDKGRVQRLPKTGGAPTTLAVGAAHNVMFDNFIAIDKATVYYASGKDVMSVAKTGGTPQKLTTMRDPVAGLATDDIDVFAMDSNEVTRVPVVGGAAVHVADTSSPAALAIDATHVYWCNGMIDVTIQRRPKH